MATYYRHDCGHTSLRHAWRTEADVPCPDPCHACRMKRVGETIHFARYGTLPSSGTSRNHRDGTTEEGLSVYEIVDGQIQYQGWWYEIATRPLYLGTGVIVGWGSDGEPLVQVATVRKARKAEEKKYHG